MKNISLTTKITHAMIFLTLVVGFSLIALVPVHSSRFFLPVPEFIAALSCAWIIRSPQTLPYLLIVCGALYLDLVLSRPVGLWALLTLLATQIWRKYSISIGNLPRVLEISLFALTLILMLLVQRLVLVLSFSELVSLKNETGYFVTSFLNYFVVLVILSIGFGLKRSKNPLLD